MKKYTLELNGHELAVMKDALRGHKEQEFPDTELCQVLSLIINVICDEVIKKIDDTGFM